MKYIMNAQAMKACDSHMINDIGVPSVVLMERAADAFCQKLLLTLSDRGCHARRILVLCGSGNNGGDGFASARILSLKGYDVTIVMQGNPEHMTEESTLESNICKSLDIPIKEDMPVEEFEQYDVIVDALLGIGLSRPISGNLANVIEAVNRAHKDGAFVASIDIPTGISCDTGQILGCAVKADMTVTMQFEKPGLLLYPGADYAGEVTAADIGIMASQKTNLFQPEKDDLKDMLPSRCAAGNKGTFGKVLVVAGSETMMGCAYLSASAALRSGSGMVKVFTTKEVVPSISVLLPEAMVSVYATAAEALEKLPAELEWCDAVLVGPGLGVSDRSWQIVRFLLEKCPKPLVLDADALNVLSQNDRSLLKSHDGMTVVTPHMGEMARISQKTIGELKADPIGCARDFAEKYGCFCVLKDARTVTASPDGRVYINVYGNDGMATAGSGDTLSGIVVSLAGQGKEPEGAVLLHAMAGDLAAGREGRPGMTASDLISSMMELYKG